MSASWIFGSSFRLPKAPPKVRSQASEFMSGRSRYSAFRCRLRLPMVSVTWPSASIMGKSFITVLLSGRLTSRGTGIQTVDKAALIQFSNKSMVDQIFDLHVRYARVLYLGEPLHVSQAIDGWIRFSRHVFHEVLIPF